MADCYGALVSYDGTSVIDGQRKKALCINNVVYIFWCRIESEGDTARYND